MNFKVINLMHHKWFRILVQFFGAFAILLIWIVYEMIPQLEQYPNLKIFTSLALIMVYLGWILWILDTKVPIARSKGLKVHKNSHEWWSWVEELITGRCLKKAYFVEYSGRYAEAVIRYLLAKTHCEVTLLIRNPEVEVDKYQQRRINTVKASLNLHFSGAPLEINCYNQPVSIRIRYIEDVVVAFGWYTYDIQKSSYDDKNKNVVGDNNIIISCTPECDLWITMKKFAIQKIREMDVEIC